MTTTITGHTIDEMRAVSRELIDHWEPDLKEFPQLLWKAAHFILEYRLNPFAGHLVVKRRRQDSPPEDVWVTTAGMIAYAKDQGDYEAVQIRPPTAEELAMLKPKEDEYVWAAVVWRKGAKHPIGPEFGRAHKSNVTKMVLAGGTKNIDAVARTRATGRVLRLAYPIAIVAEASTSAANVIAPDEPEKATEAAPPPTGRIVPKEEIIGETPPAEQPEPEDGAGEELSFLSKRARDRLNAAGITTLADVPFDEAQLLAIDGIGQTTATEILDKLEEVGYGIVRSEPADEPEATPDTEPALGEFSEDFWPEEAEEGIAI